jgi:hypothetical protein
MVPALITALDPFQLIIIEKQKQHELISEMGRGQRTCRRTYER